MLIDIECPGKVTYQRQSKVGRYSDDSVVLTQD